MSGQICRETYEGHVSLIYIQASEAPLEVLQRAAKRVCRNVRQSDTVLLLEGACAVLLPATPLAGAQAVVRRISALLIDIEYELQVLYGTAALTLVRRLQAEQAVVVDKDLTPPRDEGPARSESLPDFPSATLLPHLAFLPNYPPLRLLHLFPYTLACQYQCVPVGAERGMLTLATSQRLDTALLAHFQEVTQKRIFQVLCQVSIIDDVLRYWQRIDCMESVQTYG